MKNFLRNCALVVSPDVGSAEPPLAPSLFWNINGSNDSYPGAVPALANTWAKLRQTQAKLAFVTPITNDTVLLPNSAAGNETFNVPSWRATNEATAPRVVFGPFGTAQQS